MLTLRSSAERVTSAARAVRRVVLRSTGHAELARLLLSAVLRLILVLVLVLLSAKSSLAHESLSLLRPSSAAGGLLLLLAVVGRLLVSVPLTRALLLLLVVVVAAAHYYKLGPHDTAQSSLNTVGQREEDCDDVSEHHLLCFWSCSSANFLTKSMVITVFVVR